MLDHAFAVVAGRREPLPARGVLLTTYIYVPPLGLLRQFQAAAPVAAPPLQAVIDQLYPSELDFAPDCTIDGRLEWVTGPLLERAQAAALRHRDWARDLAQYPQTTQAAVRRAQPGAFRRQTQDDERFDYIAEALRTAPDLIERVKAGDRNKEELLSTHIEQVYNRVAARRRHAGLDVKPPAGWAEDVRGQLRPQLP
jgi:hypothetical protein